MAWIFVCDRCQKTSIDGSYLRKNGQHAGTVTIEHSLKERPTEHNPHPIEKVTLELCGECWANHENWVSGLDTITPAISSRPLPLPGK